jgi:prepilin-type N-terminal cleavage/methylation domain-containing protein
MLILRNWLLAFNRRALHERINKQVLRGFTLAELLIALAILGVIATFTIPKVLQSQQNSQKVAIAKEAASILSGALQQASFQGTLNSGTRLIDLTPYMNYVSIDTSGTTLDAISPIANITCDATHPCIRLHNGGTFGSYEANQSFGGTTALNYIEVYIDVNGRQDTSSTWDGPDKSVSFLLYYNGFLTTRDLAKAGSVSTSGAIGPNTLYQTAWFNF